jgi:soluble lytic murein transglycosylase-like protein
MTDGNKYLYFQWVKNNSPCQGLTIPLVFILLIASYPFQNETSIQTRQNDLSRGTWDNEISKVYSVVKSNMVDLEEASIVAISRTIVEESKRHSIDPLLVLAIINVESRFRSGAVSSQGARGLMQLLPPVAATLAEGTDLELDSGSGMVNPEYLDDPILNIKLGVSYLNQLKKSFRDLELALAAYNWGPTEVRNRIEGNREVPLEYTMKVLSVYHVYNKDNRRVQKNP